MHVDVGRSRPAPGRRTAGLGATRRWLDPFELLVLAAFAAVSLWVLSLDLWQVVSHGRVWTGTDGFYVVDQMQYLAWIRSASHDVFAANLFVLHSTPADYLQPAVVISAALTALGMAPWLALLLWKPVAVLAVFFAIRAYARRSLAGEWSRRTALVLALFYGSFTVVYGKFSVLGDLFPGFLSWGYTFGLIAIAAVPAALLSYERARSDERVSISPGLLAGVAGWLHPWQGELLILILIGTEIVVRRGRLEPVRRGRRLLIVTLALGALPLAYYIALGKLDQSWALAREASKHGFSLWSILLAIVPLAIPGLLAYRRRTWTFIDVATRLWPPAAFAIWFLSATALSATPLHAFDGITIPLAVLAVEAVQTVRLKPALRSRLLGAVAVAALCIPATAYELKNARDIVAPSPGNSNFITADEDRALDYLARDPDQGGVLTRFYLGTVVPERTGRRTFVGHCLWSQPQCGEHARDAQYLLQGAMKPRAAQRFVLRTRARFVLSDCASRTNLRRVLGRLVRRVDRFGCARIYEIEARRPPPAARAA